VKMKVGKIKEMLQAIPDDWEFIFSSDEEFNCLRSKGEIVELEDKPNTVVIYGFDGSELEEE